MNSGVETLPYAFCSADLRRMTKKSCDPTFCRRASSVMAPRRYPCGPNRSAELVSAADDQLVVAPREVSSVAVDSHRVDGQSFQIQRKGLQALLRPGKEGGFALIAPELLKVRLIA
jgi:hypothetical protein